MLDLEAATLLHLASLGPYGIRDKMPPFIAFPFDTFLADAETTLPCIDELKQCASITNVKRLGRPLYRCFISLAYCLLKTSNQLGRVFGWPHTGI